MFGVLIVIAVLPSGEGAKRTLGYGTLSRQKGAQPHILRDVPIRSKERGKEQEQGQATREKFPSLV